MTTEGNHRPAADLVCVEVDVEDGVLLAEVLTRRAPRLPDPPW